MKIFNNQAAQGDILIIRVEKLPENAVYNEPEDGKYIVAHSETGHHHTVTAENVSLYNKPDNDMIMYLVVDNDAELIHNRSFDQHESLGLKPGIFEIRRQRENTPEGWRRVAD